MKYRYTINVRYSDEDECFVASVPALPGCMADGKTLEDARREARVAISLWLETAVSLGRPIPEEDLWKVRSGGTRATTGYKWWDSPELGSCGYSHDGWRWYPETGNVAVFHGPFRTLEEAMDFAEKPHA